MTTQFFIPTKQQILDLQVGSLAPDYTGQLKPIVEITAKGQDVNGNWYCCYCVAHGENGRVSHSLKEDELDRSLSLSQCYKSYELDEIENQILEDRKRDTALPASVDYKDRLEDWLG